MRGWAPGAGLSSASLQRMGSAAAEATASLAGSGAHPLTEEQWRNSLLGPSEKPPVITQQFWHCIFNMLNPTVT